MADDLKPAESDRGFHGFAPIKAVPGYSGHVTVYESSSARAARVWVHAFEGPVHLSLENATVLRDQLTWLIENHYQVAG